MDRTQVMEIVRAGKRYVIAGGPWRQQRDQQRRDARLAKAEAELKRLAAVKRKKVNAQNLASQVGRTLQRLKAHKYFDYAVGQDGKLHWSRRAHLIKAEGTRDGLYLLGTNASAEQIPSAGVLSHYKNLLEVEDAFCHLKTYLHVRPVFHRRPDRVRNHVRICFLAYWLSAKLERQWRAKDQTPPSNVPQCHSRAGIIRVSIIHLRYYTSCCIVTALEQFAAGWPRRQWTARLS